MQKTNKQDRPFQVSSFYFPAKQPSIRRFSVDVFAPLSHAQLSRAPLSHAQLSRAPLSHAPLSQWGMTPHCRAHHYKACTRYLIRGNTYWYVVLHGYNMRSSYVRQILSVCPQLSYNSSSSYIVVYTYRGTWYIVGG